MKSLRERRPITRGRKPKLTRAFKLTAAGAIIVLLAICGFVLGFGTNGDRIQNGVHVGGVSVGGLEIQQAEELLNKEFADKLESKLIRLQLGDVHREINPSDIGLTYLTAETAAKAAEIASAKNPFSRISDSIKYSIFKKAIPIEVTCDNDKFYEIAAQLCESVGTPVKQYATEVEGSRLKVTNGMPGISVDPQKIVDDTLNAISLDHWEPIAFTFANIQPEPVEVDQLHEKVFSIPADARYEVSGRKINIIDEVMGKDFDKTAAEQIIQQNQNHGDVFYIPLKITEADVKKSDLMAVLFRDRLSTFQTRYNAGDRSRSSNLELASQKIDGVVLAPGENFSYNDVVGNRTYDEGFATAKVVVNGRLVDGVGGGVCQVSSTLYNAALNANLKIVNRINHQIPVSYVPLGQDATVSYGSIDFVFRNSTEYPIKVTASTSGGVCKMEIIGTRDSSWDNISSIKIENNTIRSVPFEQENLPDPALPTPTTKLEQKGVNGAVVDSYRVIVKKDGTSDREFLGKSTYRQTPQITRVGTGPAVATEELPVGESPAGETPTGETPPQTAPDVLEQPAKQVEPKETPTPESTTKPPVAYDDTGL